MKSIDINTLDISAPKLIGKQWMLITAGTPDNFNTMTASWGGLGFLWNRPVAYVFVRTNRHTAGFMNEQKKFTLSFMPESYRQDLVFCGRNSGRDVDKVANTSLKPMTTAAGNVAFEDAELVLECRTMFQTTLKEADFLDFSEVAPQWYDATNPMHVLYIAEITDTLVQ